MLRRIEQWFVVFLLVILIGGHWAILQSAAWAGMLVNYSQRATLREAWTKTFDGSNPCNLCKVVREGKKAERKQDLVKVELKLEFSYAAGEAWLFPPEAHILFPRANSSALARMDAPITPPPRNV